MYRILVISSEHTGHGHKSISQSLVNRFEIYKDEFDVRVINGFELNGPVGSFLEEHYMLIAKYARPLWILLYFLFGKFSKPLNRLTSATMKKRFQKEIEDYNPNAIISVHAGYTGSVALTLKKLKLNIPFYIILADLVNLAVLWAEPNADITICPTEESVKIMKKLGVPEEKLWLLGFPVRQAFKVPVETEKELIDITLNKKDLSILIINNSEKTHRIRTLTDSIINRFKCKVTLICARDKYMYNKLSVYYKDKKDITILGYTTNLQDYLVSHDIVVTRCGPNTMLEAVNCLTPIVSMGALPGQEKDNPLYMQKNNLGLQTSGAKDILDKIDELLKDGRKKLLEIRISQLHYYGRNASEKITSFLADNIRKSAKPS